MLAQFIRRRSAPRAGLAGLSVCIVVKTFAAVAAGLLAAVASVLGVTQAYGFYPLGLIVLLGVAAAASLATAAEAVRRLRRANANPPTIDPAQRRHDAGIVARVRAQVTRDDIEWLKGWDFGGSWRREDTEPAHRLTELDDVEHRPIDTELDEALRRLLDANREFLKSLGLCSFSERTVADERWQNIGWTSGEAEALGSKERRIWESRRDQLNADADAVAEAYDAFIDVARRKLLLGLSAARH